MRLKIFSCHHEAPDFQVENGLYATLVTGLAPQPGMRTLTDLAGKNIAAETNFSELRHQYFIWQNLLGQYDYVGFEHYRRPFYLDVWPLETMRTHHPRLAQVRHQLAANTWASEISIGRSLFDEYNKLRENLDDTQIDIVRTWVADHDVIFAYPLFDTLYRNFNINNKNVDFIWQEYVQNVRAIWPSHFAGQYFEPLAPWSAYRNMYIMRADLFDEYMSLLFTLLLPLNRKYPYAPPRLWGYLAELTCGTFIMQKAMENPLLRTRVQPYLFFDGSP